MIIKQYEFTDRQFTVIVVHLDGTKIIDKQSFLKEIAIALKLPDWFGHNWDALEDCLRDLKGKYLVVWTDTDYLNNETYNQAFKILDTYIDLLICLN